MRHLLRSGGYPGVRFIGWAVACQNSWWAACCDWLEKVGGWSRLKPRNIRNQSFMAFCTVKSRLLMTKKCTLLLRSWQSTTFLQAEHWKWWRGWAPCHVCKNWVKRSCWMCWNFHRMPLCLNLPRLLAAWGVQWAKLDPVAGFPGNTHQVPCQDSGDFLVWETLRGFWFHLWACSVMWSSRTLQKWWPFSKLPTTSRLTQWMAMWPSTNFHSMPVTCLTSSWGQMTGTAGGVQREGQKYSSTAALWHAQLMPSEQMTTKILGCMCTWTARICRQIPSFVAAASCHQSSECVPIYDVVIFMILTRSLLSPTSCSQAFHCPFFGVKELDVPECWLFI